MLAICTIDPAEMVIPILIRGLAVIYLHRITRSRR